MSASTIAVLDYGSGNLHSATRALARTGAQVEVTNDMKVALAADGLVVPGVGAFAAVMTGAVYVIIDLEFPRLGLIRVDSYDNALVDVRESMK